MSFSLQKTAALQLVVVASLLLLLLAPVSGANDTKQPNLRLRNLRWLLNEAEVPALLSYQDCLALPVNDAGGSDGGNGCDPALYWWPSWPYGNSGFCASASSFFIGRDAASTHCGSSSSELINMRNNAERCLITFWANNGASSTWYWTDINDRAAEGTYVDAVGNPVPSAYLNWAAGEPHGAGQNCVMFMNNEAYDVGCDNGPAGDAVCVQDVPAN